MRKAVISTTDEKSSNHSIKLTTQNTKTKLKLKDEINHWKLKMLPSKSVVVPTDKTSGNVAFICQRNYD